MRPPSLKREKNSLSLSTTRSRLFTGGLPTDVREARSACSTVTRSNLSNLSQAHRIFRPVKKFRRSSLHVRKLRKSCLLNVRSLLTQSLRYRRISWPNRRLFSTRSDKLYLQRLRMRRLRTRQLRTRRPRTRQLRTQQNRRRISSFIAREDAFTAGDNLSQQRSAAETVCREVWRQTSADGLATVDWQPGRAALYPFSLHSSETNRRLTWRSVRTRSGSDGGHSDAHASASGGSIATHNAGHRRTGATQMRSVRGG